MAAEARQAKSQAQRGLEGSWAMVTYSLLATIYRGLSLLLTLLLLPFAGVLGLMFAAMWLMAWVVDRATSEIQSLDMRAFESSLKSRGISPSALRHEAKKE